MSAEYRREFVEIYVSAGDDADYFAGSGFAGHGASDRGGSGALGDDAVAFGDEANCGSDFFKLCDECSVDKADGKIEH